MTNADTTNCAGWRATLIAAVALAIAAAASAAPPGPLMQLVDDPRPWTEKVAPDLVALAVSSTADLDVLLKLREPEAVHALTVSAQASTVRLQWIADTADGIERDWSPGGVRVLDRYSHIASVHATVPVHALAALAEDTRVDAVVLNRKVHKLDALGNSYMHVNAIQPPNTGTGVGIAIMDTGVDWTHPELAPLGTKTIALTTTGSTSDNLVINATVETSGTSGVVTLDVGAGAGISVSADAAATSAPARATAVRVFVCCWSAAHMRSTTSSLVDPVTMRFSSGQYSWTPRCVRH